MNDGTDSLQNVSIKHTTTTTIPSICTFITNILNSITEKYEFMCVGTKFQQIVSIHHNNYEFITMICNFIAPILIKRPSLTRTLFIITHSSHQKHGIATHTYSRTNSHTEQLHTNLLWPLP